MQIAGIIFMFFYKLLKIKHLHPNKPNFLHGYASVSYIAVARGGSLISKSRQAKREMQMCGKKNVARYDTSQMFCNYAPENAYRMKHLVLLCFLSLPAMLTAQDQRGNVLKKLLKQNPAYFEQVLRHAKKRLFLKQATTKLI
jgi:hypothetical protein